MAKREEVIAVVAAHLDCEIGEVREDSVLELLGADSLSMVEISISLEDKFNIAIPDPALGHWRTVADVMKTVEACGG